MTRVLAWLRRLFGAPRGPVSLAEPARGRALAAGLVGGVSFVAASLGLRHLTGAPSFPEEATDLAISQVPAAFVGALAGDMGGGAKPLALLTAAAAAIAGFAAAGALYGRALRAGWRPLRTAMALGLLGWLALAALLGGALDAGTTGGSDSQRRLAGLLTLLACVAVGVAATLAIVVLAGPWRSTEVPADAEEGEGPRLSRRALLVTGATLMLAADGLFAALAALARATNLGYEGRGTPDDRLTPITATTDHYVVSKNLVDPSVQADSWRLEIGGLVERPQSLDLAGLRRLPAGERVVTLECIGNPVGGLLMSTARWSGPRLRDVLASAGRRDAAAAFLLTSAVDGYDDSLPLSVALDDDTLLALDMNGAPLPDRHGFPARILVPGRYGEKQMKWVARLEVSRDDHPGFYQRQGWDSVAVVRTTSRLDSPRDGDRIAAGRPFSVRGHAYAGTRGISAVEVSVDGGAWRAATLDAPVAAAAWRFFTLAWTPAPGAHVLAVRAVDGAGARQEESDEDVSPRGASGLHRVGVQAA